MEKATVTLALEGRPTLADYAAALAHFRDLIDASSADAPITWEIDGLDMSTTITTAIGITEDSEALHRVTDDWLNIGRQLRDLGSVSNPQFAPAANGLAGLLNGRVPSLRFETEQDDVTVRSSEALAAAPEPPRLVDRGPTLGAVEGRVQTLSNRGNLRFTLWDLAFDKAVSCYLRAGQEDMMRDAWGQLVVVEGLVKRDSVSGRPISVRQVSNVKPRAEGRPGAWREAAGLLRAVGDGEPSEVTIRRLRDA